MNLEDTKTVEASRDAKLPGWDTPKFYFLAISYRNRRRSLAAKFEKDIRTLKVPR